jgi:DNA-binding response OmpR family regulator
MGTVSRIVCVAEDNEDDFFVLKRALRRHPVQLTRFENGNDLRTHLKESTTVPDIVLLDLKMPLFDGFEFLAWRAKEPKARLVPVVVFSSSTRANDVIRAYDLGAQSYFVKPSSTEEYTELVRLIDEYWLQGRTLTPAQSQNEWSGQE